MPRGPFGGPRPLLSQKCVLVIRDYTAVPSPNISGGTTPDRTEEFRQAARKHLPVASITTEPHDVAPDLFGDTLVAELESDRLPLDQYMAFIEENARLLGTDELRVVNVGIDARVAVENRFPRPFVESGVHVTELIEIRFPDEFTASDIEQVSEDLESELSWLVDSHVSGATAVLQAQGGINDIVVSQTLELVQQLNKYGILTENVTVTCEILESG